MRAKKRFGQNFLNDAHIIDRIVTAINPTQTDNLIEIGPGLGALTKPLAELIAQLTVIEIDRELIPFLNAIENVKVVEQDVLTVVFDGFADNIRLVGNLPYNISTPILFHLFHQIDLFKDMHFMLQKEVVERMASKPGNKVYGRLSVMVQYYCGATQLFIVPPEAFLPQPKIDSAIVRLIPHATRALNTEKEVVFGEVVKQAFSQRRKTLRNTLKGLVDDDLWQKINIDPIRRAETLSVDDFVAIVKEL